jgi:hypothetical protein
MYALQVTTCGSQVTEPKAVTYVGVTVAQLPHGRSPRLDRVGCVSVAPTILVTTQACRATVSIARDPAIGNTAATVAVPLRRAAAPPVVLAGHARALLTLRRLRASCRQSADAVGGSHVL